MLSICDKNLTTQLLIEAYKKGIFPMAESADAKDVFWLQPKKRGILPLNNFHISKSLKKFIHKKSFVVKIDTDFLGVIEACAKSKKGRTETWINASIIRAYHDLFNQGVCHTIEAWDGDTLVGGLYGLCLGRAFFGESMFSRQPNASKLCLAFLVELLKAHNFILLDTQFYTPHLAQFGAKEIPHSEYMNLLEEALTGEYAHFPLKDSIEMQDFL